MIGGRLKDLYTVPGVKIYVHTWQKLLADPDIAIICWEAFLSIAYPWNWCVSVGVPYPKKIEGQYWF